MDINERKKILLTELEHCIAYKKWNLNVTRNSFDNLNIAPAWLEENEIGDDKKFEISVEDNGNFFVSSTWYECGHRSIIEVLEFIQGVYDMED